MHMHSKNTAIYRIHFPLPNGSGKGSAPRWNRTNNPVIKSYKDLFFMHRGLFVSNLEQVTWRLQAASDMMARCFGRLFYLA
jgi:hypothetical protein